MTPVVLCAAGASALAGLLVRSLWRAHLVLRELERGDW